MVPTVSMVPPVSTVAVSMVPPVSMVPAARIVSFTDSGIVKLKRERHSNQTHNIGMSN